MSKLVVTTCSLNHLAQAKGLGDTLIRHNPDYRLVIGLVDRLEGRVPPGYYAPHTVVEAHTLNIPEFDDMCRRYTLLELNCALKPFFCAYALEQYSGSTVIYLDSDILVYDSLQFLEEQLQQASILLTPHISSPYPNDACRPMEKDMLKNGLFNAGFFAFRNDSVGQHFLHWLQSRMLHQCYIRAKEGLNADQTWLNLVPLFFGEVRVLDHAGCNAAYWNLHERKIEKREGRYYVNGRYPLLFFHFSGYSLQHPDQISRHQDRIRLEASGPLQELVRQYRDTLVSNRHPDLLGLKNAYTKSALDRFRKKLFKR